ncbi:MAG: 50S ribosomal protein L18 [Anaerolineae bacterium]
MATRNELRRRRHRRVRRKLKGTPEHPRLNVFRSSAHIYAQVIDDEADHTLASASTLDAEVRTRIHDMRPVEQAKVVGETVARRALEKGIRRVVFDRGGYKYHGRVKAVADGAREAGLDF